MVKFIIATMLFLSIPNASLAGEPWWYRASQIAAGASHALDLGSTTDCIARKKCVEMNPVHAGAKNPLIFSLVKGTTATATIVAVDKVPNRKWGAILNFAVSGIFTSIAVHNYKVSR